MEDANSQPVALGSGFFVRENVIASNFHVVEGASRGYAKLVGEKTKYDISGVVGADSTHDLVLLSVADAKAPALSLADSHQAAVGDEVFAVGNPQGLEGTFSQGILSSIRTVGAEALLQITAPISPGSSGGPVLNSQGKVIGVAVATFKGGQNLNFAVPANYLAALIIASSQNRITPLAREGTKKPAGSVFDDLGGRSTEGVTCGLFQWVGGYGYFKFTIQNRLRDNVKDVYCLVAFYDPQNRPIDFAVTRYESLIPGGLGKRVDGQVDASVVDMVTTLNGDGLHVQRPSARIEFRVLDFRIAE
jgi:hypothetical protein